MCVYVSFGTLVGCSLIFLGAWLHGVLGAVLYGGSYFGLFVLLTTTKISFERNRELYDKFMRDRGFLGTPEENVTSYADYITARRQREAEKEAAKNKPGP
jgi:hypothetical protein